VNAPGRDDALDFDTDIASAVMLDRDIAEVVSRRRDLDALCPVINWALGRLRNDPALARSSVGEQSCHFRKMLPDTLAGRHAADHIEWALQLYS
jgi:hypothetical protein